MLRVFVRRERVSPPNARRWSASEERAKRQSIDAPRIANLPYAQNPTRGNRGIASCNRRRTGEFDFARPCVEGHKLEVGDAVRLNAIAPAQRLERGADVADRNAGRFTRAVVEDCVVGEQRHRTLNVTGHRAVDECFRRSRSVLSRAGHQAARKKHRARKQNAHSASDRERAGLLRATSDEQGKSDRRERDGEWERAFKDPRVHG